MKLATRKITGLYAFICIDGDHESIIGFKNTRGQWIPMIGADDDQIDSLIPIAEYICRQTNKKYEIRYFETKQ